MLSARHNIIDRANGRREDCRAGREQILLEYCGDIACWGGGWEISITDPALPRIMVRQFRM